MARKKSSTRKVPARVAQEPQENVTLATLDADDEVDAFHSSRDKVRLAGYDDSDPSDEEAADAEAFDEHVLDVEESGSDDDDDTLDMEHYLKKMPALRKQLNALEHEEELSDNDDEDNEGAADGDETVMAWGSRKNIYYNDDMDMDEEAAAEEEEEAMRAQKEKARTMRDSDFLDDFKDTFSSCAVKVDSDADKQLLEQFDQQLEQVNFTGEAELIQKNLQAMPRKERIERVLAEAPEMLDLLSEFKDKATEVTERVAPLLERLRAQELPTSQGVSLLEVKNQMLLNYCLNLAFYFYLKAEGKSVKNHPVIEKLVELRLYLEKIKPLEQKLQYQIDKLVKTAVTGTVDQADPLRHAPNPDALFDSDGDVPEKNGSKTLHDASDDDVGLYRAPKIAPVHFTDGQELHGKERGATNRKSAANQRIMKELAAEVMDAPEEVVDAGNQLTHVVRSDRDWEDRIRAEEEMMVRLPVTRADKTKMKNQAKITNEMHNLNDFDDMSYYSGAIVDDDEDDGVRRKKLMRSLINPTAPTADGKGNKRKTGGDSDLPRRDRKAVVNSSRGEDYNTHLDDDAGDGMPAPEDDPFYLATRDHKQQKRAAKESAMAARNEPAFQDVEEQIDGKRVASYAILKNKGLTPVRSKEQRNPRVKQRNKYERSMKKLKSVKATMRAQDKPYHGEETGIKKNLARSVKF